MRCAEHVTPALSVRDSEAVLTVVWDLHFTSSTSRMLPRCLALGFFCCLTLFGSDFTVTSRFRGSRCPHSQGGGAIQAHMLSRGSVLVELEAVLYSVAGEACTISRPVENRLPDV